MAGFGQGLISGLQTGNQLWNGYDQRAALREQREQNRVRFDLDQRTAEASQLSNTFQAMAPDGDYSKLTDTHWNQAMQQAPRFVEAQESQLNSDPAFQAAIESGKVPPGTRRKVKGFRTVNGVLTLEVAHVGPDGKELSSGPLTANGTSSDDDMVIPITAQDLQQSLQQYTASLNDAYAKLPGERARNRGMAQLTDMALEPQAVSAPQTQARSGLGGAQNIPAPGGMAVTPTAAPQAPGAAPSAPVPEEVAPAASAPDRSPWLEQNIAKYQSLAAERDQLTAQLSEQGRGLALFGNRERTQQIEGIKGQIAQIDDAMTHLGAAINKADPTALTPQPTDSAPNTRGIGGVLNRAREVSQEMDGQSVAARSGAGVRVGLNAAGESLVDSAEWATRPLVGGTRVLMQQSGEFVRGLVGGQPQSTESEPEQPQSTPAMGSAQIGGDRTQIGNDQRQPAPSAGGMDKTEMRREITSEARAQGTTITPKFRAALVDAVGKGWITMDQALALAPSRQADKVVDLGDRVVVLDKQGGEINRFAKGASPDAMMRAHTEQRSKPFETAKEYNAWKDSFLGRYFADKKDQRGRAWASNEIDVAVQRGLIDPTRPGYDATIGLAIDKIDGERRRSVFPDKSRQNYSLAEGIMSVKLNMSLKEAQTYVDAPLARAFGGQAAPQPYVDHAKNVAAAMADRGATKVQIAQAIERGVASDPRTFFGQSPGEIAEFLMR